MHLIKTYLKLYVFPVVNSLLCTWNLQPRLELTINDPFFTAEKQESSFSSLHNQLHRRG